MLHFSREKLVTLRFEKISNHQIYMEILDFELPEEKAYSARISRKTLMEIKKGVRKYIIVGRRYRNPKYSARQLAEDIGVNTRYLSAALQLHYNCNFNELVNKLRIDDAKEIMLEDDNQMTMEDVALSAGFCNRQSFYTAFGKFVGMKPKEWLTEQKRLRDDELTRQREQTRATSQFEGIAFD